MTHPSRFAEILQDTADRLINPLTLFVWLAGWVIAAVGGPFGTFEDMPFGVRIGFWGAVASCGVIAGYGARAVAQLTVGDARPVLFDLVAIGVMTALFPLVILVIGGYVEARMGAAVPPLPVVVLYVFVIAAPVFVLRRLVPGIERRRYPFLPGAEEAETPDRPMPRLMARLDPELRGDLMRLSGKGHYTEVVTRAGTATLRLRLSDAIAETEPVRGHWTHRSHWVAEAAISEIRRDSPQKLVVVLQNAETVPVSRTHRATLAAAGFVP